MKQLLIIQAPCTFTPVFGNQSEGMQRRNEHMTAILSQFEKIKSDFDVIVLVKDPDATSPYDWEWGVVGNKAQW